MAAIHWNTTASGDWSTASNWSSGTVPGSGDDVTIALAGTYTVTISDNEAAHSLTLDNAGATVEIGNGGNNTFTVGATLSLTAGTLQLNQGATIAGGTLSATGGAFNWNGGELSGVTYDGALNMTSGRSSLLVNGLTLKGANGTGSGTINMGGQYDARLLAFGGTLDNATVNMSDGARYSYTQISLFDPGDSNPGLTLGAHLDIVQTTGNSSIGQNYNFANNSLVNDGTITTSGGSFTIGVNNVVNNGLIAISGGEKFTINANTLTEGAGGKITVASGSSLHLGVDLTTAQLTSITNQGKIGIGGGYGITLTNTGATLTVGTGTADPTIALYANGILQGGTVVDKGSGLHIYGGTLSSATFDGTLDLTPGGSAVVIETGLTLAGVNGSGPGTIDLASSDGAIVAYGNLSLDNATLNIGSYGGDFIDVRVPTGAGATLTLGAHFDIVHSGRGVTVQAAAYAQGVATIVNDGTITASYHSGNFVFQGGAVVNNGSIAVSNGDTLNLDSASFSQGAGGAVSIGAGSTLNIGATQTTAQISAFSNSGTLGIAGTLINTGATLQIGSGTSEPKIETQGGGVIVGGTIVNEGAGVFFNGGTLSGVTFEGTVDLTPTYSSLVITNGLTATGLGGVGAGTIDLGFLAFLRPEGSETLDDATVELGYGNGIVLTDPNNTAPVLTLGKGFAVIQTSNGGFINGGNYGNDLVINDGLIEAAFNGNNSQGFSITTPNFTNNGSLIVGNGQVMSVQPGNLTNLSGTTLTGGDFEVDGASTMELNQNLSIVTLDATLILNGAGATLQSFNTNSNSQVAIDSTLGTIGAAGILEINGNRNWSSPMAMSNAGSLLLGGGTFTAPSLANTGTLSGYGVVAAAVTNSGTLTVSGGNALSLVGGSLTNLSGTTLTGGFFAVGAGGTLQLANNVSIVTLKATIDLQGAGATVQSLNTTSSSEVSLADSLKTIAATSELGILGGASFTTTNTLANAGTIVLGGGTLTAAMLTNTGMISGFGAIAGTLTSSGTISAQSGETLSLQNLTFNGQAGATVLVNAGATLQAPNNTRFQTLDFRVILNGVGSILESLNTSTSTELTFEQGSTGTGATGVLEVLGGRNYTTTNALSNSGVLQLGGGTFTSGLMTQASGSTLTGFGLIASTIADAGTTKSVGGALAFTGKGNVFSAALSGTEIDFSGGTDLLQAGSSLTAGAIGVSGGAVVTLAVSQSYAGKLTQASGTTLALGADTLTLTAGVSSLSGSVTGTGGTLVFAGGSQTIGGGAALGMDTWSITGGTTSINESLTFKGGFAESAGATLGVTSGNKLTLAGAATLAGLVNGAGAVKVSTATIGGLTIGGTSTLVNAGTVTQTGTLTVGDKSLNGATLLIATGATYTIESGGIAHGAATTSVVEINGTLVDTAPGATMISVRVGDNGSIVASGGTLDLAKTLTGTGSMTIDSGATLEVDQTASATLSVTFSGANARLALGNPAKFAAPINGFATGDTIDLLGKAATTAVLGAGDKLVITNGGKAVATLQLVGTYTGDTFNVSSDGSGGADITVTAAPIGPFVDAMASIASSQPAQSSLTAQSAALHPIIATPGHI